MEKKYLEPKRVYVPCEEQTVQKDDVILWGENEFAVQKVIDEANAKVNGIIYRIVEFIDAEGVYRCWNQFHNGGTVVKGEQANAAI